MTEQLIDILRCPVTRSVLSVRILKKSIKYLDGNPVDIIEEAILSAGNDWFYPVINGIPRLTAEAFLDYDAFLRKNMDDYALRKKHLLEEYGGLIKQAVKKNKRTKASFSKEWQVYDFDKDKTWDADDSAMLDRFLKETDETITSLKGKIIFDAGCGNGKLNLLLGKKGVVNIAMDFSSGIEAAYGRNSSANVHFIQGDVQFPPVAMQYFDIVHCSGVLIHTNNTELSFSCIDTAVKPGGKLSVWLYHPRKDFIHNLFNGIRSLTSKLPLSIQYYLYYITILPVGYCIKRLKGNKQNTREMMVDILDWFTPQYRWEHEHSEVKSWFYKRNYKDVKTTTDELFGFNTVGTKR